MEKSHLGFFLIRHSGIAKQRGKRFLRESEEVQKSVIAKSIKIAKSNPVMTAVMNFESALRRRIYYPVGIRCLVTCQENGT